jgi:hypothetical protein
MKHYKLIIPLLLLFQLSAKAQNFFGLLNNGQHILSAGVNANPHLNANADYLYAFEEREGTFQRFGIITQANFPIFSQKGFDFDFRIGTGALIGFSNQFKALTGVTWNLSRTADLNGRYFHSGFKIDFLPGYYVNNWVFAPHLSLNYQPFIRIKHSDYAKNTFQNLYPNGNGQYTSPKDGWFTQNNLTFQTGISIAYFQPKWHLNMTAGFQHQPNRLGLIALPDIGIMPFYGGLNFGYSITDK